MKQYYANPKYNKAAFILAMMAPDMVEDMIGLVNSRGQALIGDLFNTDDEGPARPLAIFSRDYIADQDAPSLALGFSAVVLANFKQIKGDADFYEDVLKSAFSLPSEIAQPMSKRIETYDILGGQTAGQDGWLQRMSRQLQEGIRRGVNIIPRLFGSGEQNDQAQTYDIDFLYEMKLLGQGVDEMMARLRLMRGQANIAKQLGIFNVQGFAKGDVYGDVYGDTQDVSDVIVSDTLKPLMGGPLPLTILGGLAKLAKAGFSASTEKLKGLADKAGVSPGSTGASDPNLAASFAKISSGDDKSIVSQIDGQDVSLGQVKKALELIHSARSQGKGDVYGEVQESYGDVAAQHFADGNLPALLSHIIGVAEGPMPTTGDPELDEAIVADVLDDNSIAMGDVEQAMDAELGGLFTKAKIKHAIKKGKRKQRKNTAFVSKQKSKDKRSAQLAQARQFAAGQLSDEQMNELHQGVDPDDLEPIDESMQTDPEFNTGFDNSQDNPDDFYNLASVQA